MVSVDLPDKFAGVKVHYLVYENITVSSIPPRVKKQARRIEAELNERHTIATIRDDPIILSWISLYQEMGIDADEIRPACYESAYNILTGRNIAKINNIVDIANITMAKFLFPVGAFDFGNIEGDISLRISQKGENYVPLFSSEEEEIPEGEIVYADSKGIFSRYSKDADRTRIRDETKTVIFVIDGTKDVSDVQLSDCARFLGGMVADIITDAKLIENKFVCA